VAIAIQGARLIVPGVRRYISQDSNARTGKAPAMVIACTS
jgi:hypothetical protein